MPATTKTTKTTTRKSPAKGKATTTAKPKAEPKAKFVIPPKPTTDPTSLNEADYQYELPNGKRRFWQGYDAKFKKVLMAVSRQLPQTDESKQARDILVAKGWSTAEYEAEQVQKAKDRAQRVIDRATAKAEAAKGKQAVKVAA